MTMLCLSFGNLTFKITSVMFSEAANMQAHNWEGKFIVFKGRCIVDVNYTWC